VSDTAFKIRVWDLPTRLFHWTLAALVIASFVSVKTGNMDWHGRLGYAVLALLLFRLVWGFASGGYSRFTAFVRGPGSVMAYLRGASHGPGHNPLGALSVLAMLAALLFQASSGLFTNDDIAFEGPLSRHISNALSSLLTTWHRRNENILIALVVVHVAAIVYYRLRLKRDLIGPMLTGDAVLQSPYPNSPDNLAMRLRAARRAGECSSAAMAPACCS
jgi:cytochrome b